MSAHLTPQQEALAHELAHAIQQAATDDILQIARLLIATDETHLFGDTEFKIRRLLLKLGAKAYDAHLAEKKTTATTATASLAPTANDPPPTTATGLANS